MEYNKYYIGDNLELIKELEDDSIDLVVCSPPYGKLRKYGSYEGYNFEELAKELYRVIAKGGVICWNEGDSKTKGSLNLTPYEHALFFKSLGFRIHQTLIYEKNGCPPHVGLYTDVIEYIFVLSKGKPKTINLIEDRKNKWGGTQSFGVSSSRMTDDSLKKRKGKSVIKEYGRRTTIWKYVAGKFNGSKDESAFINPATMPDGLAMDLIQSYSVRGDIVLDPFAGSGTTLKMARMMGRNFIGFELNEEYIPILEDRIYSDELLSKDSEKLNKYLDEQ